MADEPSNGLGTAIIQAMRFSSQHEDYLRDRGLFFIKAQKWIVAIVGPQQQKFDANFGCDINLVSES
jgi:hypothetical protein